MPSALYALVCTAGAFGHSEERNLDLGARFRSQRGKNPLRR